MVRYGIREARKEIPSACMISIVGGVLSLAVMVGVRWWLPASAEVLTCWRMLAIMLACSSFVWLGHLPAILPSNVHITEKGVFFQCGSSVGRVDCEQLRSISFEDRNGLHLLVVRGVSKQGREFERTALASPRYSDEEVAKFLFEAGLSHVWHGSVK